MKSLVAVLSAMIFSPKMSNAVIAVDNTEPPSPSGLDRNADVPESLAKKALTPSQFKQYQQYNKKEMTR